MLLRRHILALLLAVVASTAPHLHLEGTVHDCVHFETLEAAGDSQPSSSNEHAIEPCLQCRVQTTRSVAGSPAASTPAPPPGLRLAAPCAEQAARSALGRGLSGPRGPPFSSFA